MINSVNYNINDFQRINKKNNPNKLSIYYYNDTHGDTDLMAGLLSSAKAFKDRMKMDGTSHFVLSAGDNCTGADTKKNSFVFELMQNWMGVDISAVGNHECDAGAQGFYNAANDKKMKFVATNAAFSNENPLNQMVKKSLIEERDGVKYGFVGALPIGIKQVLKKDAQEGIDSLDFDNTVKALQNEINSLKSQGVNRIIMVSHLGHDVDKQIARNLDGVDVIIGGHSHTPVEGAKAGENLVASKSGEPVIITQAGANSEYFGNLDLEFNLNGVLTKVNNQLVQNQNKLRSPIVQAIKNSKLGVSPKVAVIKEIEPAPKERKAEPSAWTALMADAMKAELGTEIALINSANIRKFPQAGTLTEADIKESAPMGNKLIKTRITQKQLVDAVRNVARQTYDSKGDRPGLMQGSGFTYKLDAQGNLSEMNFIEKDGTLTPINVNNPSEKITYSAAYDSFVAQADGETPELVPQFEVEHYDFDKDVTMKNYLSKRADKEEIKVIYDNRIQIARKATEPQQGNNSQRFLSLTSPKAS